MFLGVQVFRAHGLGRCLGVFFSDILDGKGVTRKGAQKWTTFWVGCWALLRPKKCF